MKIDSWIVRNLIEYRNTLIPNKIMGNYSKEELEIELSKLSGMPVQVYSTKIPRYDQGAYVSGTSITKIRKQMDTLWIAKVKES